MAPDLGIQYAKHMNHFGCGLALYQPVSAQDMRPPCVGYLDLNRRWNLIANIEWLEESTIYHFHDTNRSIFKPLTQAPRKMEQLGIEWRPRVSSGVRQWMVDANGKTP